MKILESGVDFVVIKKGEHGVLIFNKDYEISIPGYLTNIVKDPTGAGDSFLGGFLYSYIKNMNIEDNMRYAISSAGLKISGRGGIQSQPTKDEVEKYINLVKVKKITYQ